MGLESLREFLAEGGVGLWLISIERELLHTL